MRRGLVEFVYALVAVGLGYGIVKIYQTTYGRNR